MVNDQIVNTYVFDIWEKSRALRQVRQERTGHRFDHLTEHLKLNRKDFGTERALTNLVGKRRRLLDYLKAKDIEKYRELIKELGIRK